MADSMEVVMDKFQTKNHTFIFGAAKKMSTQASVDKS